MDISSLTTTSDLENFLKVIKDRQQKVAQIDLILKERTPCYSALFYFDGGVQVYAHSQPPEIYVPIITEKRMSLVREITENLVAVELWFQKRQAFIKESLLQYDPDNAVAECHRRIKVED
jgi:hypothetical protein